MNSTRSVLQATRSISALGLHFRKTYVNFYINLHLLIIKVSTCI